MMGREFEQHRAAEVPATPEQVWEAIATGPGVDSWFMGRTEVEPGAGGLVRTEFGGYAPAHPVTAWQPGRRLAYGGERAADGRWIAYEFLIEGRTGTTVLRMAVSGFLPGDDWQDEFDAMTKGGELFFHTLVAYLAHFTGRVATPVTVFGPPVPDWDRAWALLHGALGMARPPVIGDPVRCRPAGLPRIDGTVYFTNPHTLGVRTKEALYRFLRGFQGPMIAAHHLFTGGEGAGPAWRAWLHRVHAPELAGAAGPRRPSEGERS